MIYSSAFLRGIEVGFGIENEGASFHDFLIKSEHLVCGKEL